VRASTGQRLLSVPKFSQVVVAISGAMARMPTVHPMAFARIKRQLSQDPKRDPRKAPKDKAQADIVESLVEQFLPQLATEPSAEEDVPNSKADTPTGAVGRHE
jgi:hypothetical protein